VPDPAELPDFAYHPRPDLTGAVEAVDRVCTCCGSARGWVYVLGAYGPDDLRDALCPWCIADGSAAERFGVRFTDLGTSDAPSDVPAQVLDTIEHRTPGFSGWQQERWLFHCGDGAAFLGAVGWEALADLPDAEAAVRAQVTAWGWAPAEVEAFVGSLDVDGASTAYLFRCRHCATHLAYADAD
jgi:uncharacterized protein CbrC (UPF0167 family)